MCIYGMADKLYARHYFWDGSLLNVFLVWLDIHTRPQPSIILTQSTTGKQRVI